MPTINNWSMPTTDHWNCTGHSDAVGWSFGLFGRLSPDLLWLICRSNQPELQHPDILQLLYVLRLSSQCDGRRLCPGSLVFRYLSMDDWDELIDLEMMEIGDTSDEWDTTEEFDDDDLI
jgi:hypothetical protein